MNIFQIQAHNINFVKQAFTFTGCNPIGNEYAIAQDVAIYLSYKYSAKQVCAYIKNL